MYTDAKSRIYLILRMFSSIVYSSLIVPLSCLLLSGGRKASVMAYASEKRHSAKSYILRNYPFLFSSIVYFSLIVPLSCLLLSGGRKASVMAYALEKRQAAKSYILRNYPFLFSSIVTSL